MDSPKNILLDWIPPRLRDWGMTRYGFRPLVPLAATLIAAVLATIFHDWVFGKALPWIWDGLKLLVAHPIGPFGLAFGVYLAVLVGLGWLETSPTVKEWRERRSVEVIPASAVLPPLSADDKDAAAALRTLWHDDGGQESAFAMKYLLEMCHERLKEKYYASVYADSIKSLADKGGALDAALAFDPPMPPGNVRAVFEAWFRAFMRGAEILYDAHQQKDIDLGAPELLRQFKNVRTAYKKFSAGVVHANNYQGVDRKLKVFAMPGDELSSRKFLGEQIWNGPSPLEENDTPQPAPGM